MWCSSIGSVLNVGRVGVAINARTTQTILMVPTNNKTARLDENKLFSKKEQVEEAVERIVMRGRAKLIHWLKIEKMKENLKKNHQKK